MRNEKTAVGSRTPIWCVYSLSLFVSFFEEASNHGAELVHTHTLWWMRLAWVEEFKMAQSVRGEEQYLLDVVADLLTRMSELERLREVVRLAEATKTLPSRELPRQVVNSKVVDLFCRASTARLTNAGACHPWSAFERLIRIAKFCCYGCVRPTRSCALVGTSRMQSLHLLFEYNFFYQPFLESGSHVEVQQEKFVDVQCF